MPAQPYVIASSPALLAANVPNVGSQQVQFAIDHAAEHRFADIMAGLDRVIDEENESYANDLAAVGYNVGQLDPKDAELKQNYPIQIAKRDPWGLCVGMGFTRLEVKPNGLGGYEPKPLFNVVGNNASLVENGNGTARFIKQVLVAEMGQEAADQLFQAAGINEEAGITPGQLRHLQTLKLAQENPALAAALQNDPGYQQAMQNRPANHAATLQQVAADRATLRQIGAEVNTLNSAKENIDGFLDDRIGPNQKASLCAAYPRLDELVKKREKLDSAGWGTKIKKFFTHGGMEAAKASADAKIQQELQLLKPQVGDQLANRLNDGMDVLNRIKVAQAQDNAWHAQVNQASAGLAHQFQPNHNLAQNQVQNVVNVEVQNDVHFSENIIIGEQPEVIDLADQQSLNASKAKPKIGDLISKFESGGSINPQLSNKKAELDVQVIPGNTKQKASNIEHPTNADLSHSIHRAGQSGNEKEGHQNQKRHSTGPSRK